MKNNTQLGTSEVPGDQRLNLLQIIGTATHGGMENQIIALLKNLPAQQFTVTCICPCESPFTKSLRDLGVEHVYVTPLADDPHWRSIQLVMEAVRLHKIDIIHAHMPKSHVLAGIAGALVHKPVVATVHGMHVTPHELGVALAVRSHLIANCQETYIQALALGVPKERVNLIHNGVDPDVFNPNKSGKKFRELMGIPATATLVGFVGRLEHEKGPDLFLRAADYIHHLRPEVHFAIVGDGSMREKLGAMSRQMRLGRQLHFADWATDTAAVYPSFDIVAHTSRSDGTSLVLLEAMACGRPVVGMGIGGVREIIENEHGGMLVEPGDWEGLGNQVLSLLKQPDLLKKMGVAARRRIEEKFTVLSNSLQTADLLRKVGALAKSENMFKANHHVFSNGNGLSLSNKSLHV